MTGRLLNPLALSKKATISADDGQQSNSIGRTLPPRDSLEKSIIDSVISVARIRVNRLLLIWIQLVIVNFLLGAVTGDDNVGFLLGIASIPLILPINIIISRLAGRSYLISFIIGGLVTALFEAAYVYRYLEWTARFGIVFGAFFGASLASYFSAEDKHTNLFWALVITFFLIAALVIPEIALYGVETILEVANYRVGASLMNAVYTIFIGLLLSPVITPLMRFIEAVIDRISKLHQIRR